MLKKVIIIALGVSFMGADLAIGTEVELSEKSADALIAEGKAEGGEPAAELGDPHKQYADLGGNEPTEEEKQVKALDAQYKRDELYAAAKEVGVDMAFDAKKGDIIAAVIAQGFAAALMK